MSNARYTISFPSKDFELIQFVEEKRKHNGLSTYIRELIRRDMNNRESENLEQIYLYVANRLRESGLTVKQNGNSELKEPVDELDKEVILNLF